MSSNKKIQTADDIDSRPAAPRVDPATYGNIMVKRPRRKSVQLNLRVAPGTKQRLDEAAERMNLSQSAVVSAALDLFLSLDSKESAEATARWMHRQQGE